MIAADAAGMEAGGVEREQVFGLRDPVAHVNPFAGDEDWYDGDNPRHVILGGGMLDTPHSFVDYLAHFDEDFQPYLAAIARTVRENGWVGVMASEINDRLRFWFEDGTQVAFTGRAWGDLQSALVGKREGYSRYAW